MAYGDGHFITFDGERYSFEGSCEYTLAQVRGPPPSASTRWPRYMAPRPPPGQRAGAGAVTTSLSSPSQDYCAGNNASNGSFRIVTENVPCGTTGVTCSKAIKIFLEVGAPGNRLPPSAALSESRPGPLDLQLWPRVSGPQ